MATGSTRMDSAYSGERAPDDLLAGPVHAVLRGGTGDRGGAGPLGGRRGQGVAHVQHQCELEQPDEQRQQDDEDHDEVHDGRAALPSAPDGAHAPS